VDLAKALKIRQLENTRLQDVTFSYELRDGKMITKPFNVKIDRIQANVGGSTAFADQAIDYDLKAKIPSDMFGAGASQAVAGLLGKANQAVGGNFEVPKELDMTAKITGSERGDRQEEGRADRTSESGTRSSRCRSANPSRQVEGRCPS
jgi:hypothetical protein